MMVRNWGASSIAADKIAAAHKMLFEIFGLFNFFFILSPYLVFQCVMYLIIHFDGGQSWHISNYSTNN